MELLWTGKAKTETSIVRQIERGPKLSFQDWRTNEPSCCMHGNRMVGDQKEGCESLLMMMIWLYPCRPDDNFLESMKKIDFANSRILFRRGAAQRGGELSSPPLYQVFSNFWKNDTFKLRVHPPTDLAVSGQTLSALNPSNQSHRMNGRFAVLCGHSRQTGRTTRFRDLYRTYRLTCEKTKIDGEKRGVNDLNEARWFPKPRVSPILQTRIINKSRWDNDRLEGTQMMNKSRK